MILTETNVDVPPPNAFADRLNDRTLWEHSGAHWTSAEKKKLVCCRIIDEMPDVKTFVLSAADGILFSFEPGQFITISVEVNGQMLSRCYTISSPPTRPYTLSISVKRVPGGAVSNWLHEHLQLGGTLMAYGPAGVFTLSSHPASKSLFLSAGSGVTPLMSMTRAGHDLGLNRDVVFLHSARTPADIIFRNELSQLSASAVRLRVVHLCESAGLEKDWRGPVGRLSLELMERYVPDFREREVFTCGPAGYMQSVRKILAEGGHDPARYHQESFDITAGGSDDGTTAATASPSNATAGVRPAFSVRLARSGKSFTMSDTETVLAAARKAGVPVPSSCGQGLCGTCKTAVLQGDVDMQHNGGIRQREIDKGLRLLCCSRPQSDLVLDL
ncbi:2Fe-2S iron-sulfur cluster-binding protein [Paraburkholderia caffeinilytica]|uniref:2Fe-2S iron-sulfur cluster-binding protein n=1 Tax=Paraburkholderia caffeinilytica TaxID=1761016 RepID=UPI003DA137DB